jgi:hypothetical protein
MQGRGIPVSREALYEEVWSDPATIVAPRYGLSDVGLLKICKKLHIPVPGRGYWARITAGRPGRKPPLPALAAGSRVPLGPTPLSPDEVALRARVQAAVQQTRECQAPMSVPSELVEPHALVRAAASRLKQSDGWDHPAGVRSAPTEVLNLHVTRNSLDRALRLMDTLLKALEPSGFTAMVDAKKGESLLVGEGTTLSISIVEQVTRSAHTPTRAEVQARKRYYDSSMSGPRVKYPEIPQFDWTATGRLTLQVGTWPSRKWNDTEHGHIDARMREIIPVIVGLAVAKRVKEAEEQRRQQAYAEAVAGYEAQVQARHDEERRLRALLRDSVRLQRATRLREFIAAFEGRARQDGEYTIEKERWVEWANAKADWLDPLVRRTDPILDTPLPAAPSYWKF